jgi:hypothetical protein
LLTLDLTEGAKPSEEQERRKRALIKGTEGIPRNSQGFAEIKNLEEPFQQTGQPNVQSHADRHHGIRPRTS